MRSCTFRRVGIIEDSGKNAPEYPLNGEPNPFLLQQFLPDKRNNHRAGKHVNGLGKRETFLSFVFRVTRSGGYTLNVDELVVFSLCPSCLVCFTFLPNE